MKDELHKNLERFHLMRKAHDESIARIDLLHKDIPKEVSEDDCDDP